MEGVVLSGNRPTGRIHLGHFFGALDNWVKLQEKYSCFFFAADWHALTTEYANPNTIKKNTYEMFIDWFSAGIDPQKSVIFIQSEIKQHAELHVLLSMITPLGWLERVPSYKEIQQELKDRDLATYGFLGYPLLQTADILIYNADYVPVGVDQVPHIELAREIARRFNHLYGSVFKEPHALLTEVPKVPGTDGRKMSKSYGNAIYLTDTDDEIRKKLLQMITDPNRKRRFDPGEPEVCPVFSLHKIFTEDEKRQELATGCRTASIGCIDCKSVLISNITKFLEPIRERRSEIVKHMDEIPMIIDEGNKKAREVAEKTMERVRKAIFGSQK
ncbi:MAG: tryptophan--tRNA ligase [Candidatus Aenigmatarchaeota archaeon]